MGKALFLTLIFLFSPFQSSGGEPESTTDRTKEIAAIKAEEAKRQKELADQQAATKKDNDLKHETEEKAALGQASMIVGAVGAKFFWNKGEACTADAVCEYGYKALSVTSALVAVDGLIKSTKIHRAGDQIDGPQGGGPQGGGPQSVTIPEACASDPLCGELANASLALVNRPNEPAPDVCLGTDVCITPALDGASKVSINGDTLTEEEVNELANQFASNPANSKSIKTIQRAAQNVAEGSMSGKQIELEEKVKKVKKVVKRKTLKKDNYAIGKGFSASPTPTPSASYESEERADPFEKKLQGLMAQFQKGKKKRKPAHKAITVGKNKVGAIQENIFVMAHRRYQKLRNREEVIEQTSKTRVKL